MPLELALPCVRSRARVGVSMCMGGPADAHLPQGRHGLRARACAGPQPCDLAECGEGVSL